MHRKHHGLGLLLLAVLASAPRAAFAQATLLNTFGGPLGYGTQCMSPNDDGSSDAISLTMAFPGGLSFFGGPYSTVWVNNNGNITFNNSLYVYTPSAFPVASEPMIAPYWGDVDTRGDSCSTSSADCHGMLDNNVWWAFEPEKMVVTWNQVGYYGCHADRRMSFQLILSTACAMPSGDFDVEFRYNRCEWTTGDASGGSGGFGGTPAQAGFDAGDLVHYNSLPGSLTMGILNLCSTSNIGMPGRWLFQIRGGQVRSCDDPAAHCTPCETAEGDSGVPVDACVGYMCRGENPLLLEGRAGPVGCACRTTQRASNARPGLACMAVGVVMSAVRRRRRPRV